MKQKLIFTGILLTFGICALVFYRSADQDSKEYYIPLQEQAAQLMALNCQEQQCVTEGQIEYLETESLSRKRFLPGPSIYFYRYSFTVDGVEYTKELCVFGEKTSFFGSGVRYLPTAKLTLGKTFPEKIIYDPQNPNINLPVDYAKVLHLIPDPHAEDKKNAYFILLMGLFIAGAGFIDWKRGN